MKFEVELISVRLDYENRNPQLYIEKNKEQMQRDRVKVNENRKFWPYLVSGSQRDAGPTV